MCLPPNAGTLKQNRGMRIAVRLLHQAADARPRDAVLLCDLRQRHAGTAVLNHLIDFVIAEVKSGNRNKLNGIWQPDNEDAKVGRVGYLLRWMGALGDEQRVTEVASRLHKEHRARENGYLFRLLYFSHSHTKQAVPAVVPQITFREIAEFIVTLRTPSWKVYGMGVRSLHGQWDKLIRDIWDIGNPDSQLSEAQKIEAILALLAD